VPRRRALTGWARANGALIAEDDYDGEFATTSPRCCAGRTGPRGGHLPGKHHQDTHPALRAGWLAARPEPVTQLAQAADRLGGCATDPAQRAVLTPDHHQRPGTPHPSMRHEYTRRRAVLAAVFRDRKPGTCSDTRPGNTWCCKPAGTPTQPPLPPASGAWRSAR
jgi:DNA-binding transcriptional MocR family regulator